MGSLSLILLVSIIFLSLGSLTAAQPECNNIIGNFTVNSTYGKNRNLILSSLPTNVADSGGYYTASIIGQDTDNVYALALCRGDISSEICHDCVNSSCETLMKNCPNQKEAINWEPGPQCIVRYSNRSFFGKKEVSPILMFYNVNNVSSNMDQFDQVYTNLTYNIVSRAAMGSSKLKFATGDAKLTDSDRRMYVLMQCTPDLSESYCTDCLQGTLYAYQSCCHGKVGGAVLTPSCVFRFDLYRFYEDTADAPPTPSPLPPPISNYPPPPSTNRTTTKDKRSSTSRTVVIIVPIIISLILIALGFAIFLMRKPKEKFEDKDANDSVESLRYDLSTIKAATNDFSDANKLGQGGFGSVYKGMLSNGQEVAVKRLAQCSAQGELEFKNEIVTMARLQHRNLVRLIGFCLEDRERLLIYELMPNASLDNFIFDPIKRLLLSWERRFIIIRGVARGLLYLHEDSQFKIIHRDLKAGNVLLDGEMNPKISDFGMARMFVIDQSQGDTRRIAGTFGYMAPEYANYGQMSVKTDVFSFGVLVLEIVSGKKNSFVHNSGRIEHLLSYAWKKWKKGAALHLMDPTLVGANSISEILRCIHIGLLCVQEKAAQRPTMASIVLMFSETSLSLPQPSEPTFLIQVSDPNPTVPSPDNIPAATGLDQMLPSSQMLPPSVNDASISELYPR